MRLVKALHAVIETGEALPVWRHKKERGLRALTEPIALKLRLVKKTTAEDTSDEAENLVAMQAACACQRLLLDRPFNFNF